MSVVCEWCVSVVCEYNVRVWCMRVVCEYNVCVVCECGV